MDFEKIVHAALAGWVYGQKTGAALIDLRTGALVTRSLDPDQVKEYSEDHHIVIFTIEARDNLYDADSILPIPFMHYLGLITDEEFKKAEEEKNPEFINQLRQKYYENYNTSIETLGVQEMCQSGEMDWFYIHDQLMERYR